MLDPFAQLFQHCWGHARSLRMVYKDLWVVSFPRCTAGPNIVGSCCIRLHTTANTHATTHKNVGATVLGVVAFVCTKPKCDIKAENSSTWCEFHEGRKGLRPMGSNADYLLLSQWVPVLVLTLGTLRYEDGELGRRLNWMSKTRSSPVVPAKNK